MKIYKLTIAYDGTAYVGWQVQPNGISVQELIEKALQTIVREEVKVIGAGRTDAGVHALGQVAHFHSDKEIDAYKFLRSMNGLLPKDIRILSVEHVADSFHAQYCAESKIYRYHLFLDQVLNPFKRQTVWHYPFPFDVKLLRLGAEAFIGTHDFTSFANEAHSGVAAHDAVRTLSRIDIIEEQGGIALEFEGDGFLYKMVRNMVGTLVDCAAGKCTAEKIAQILAAKDRRLAGMAAPPQGLFLVKVKYSESSGR